ncbi:MAG: ATP cone domain-containing protein [Verrucomicrobiota bacterium]|nr:ATP cone domain-containing protein [Verrucomicrobiota bacterium]
MRCPKCGHLEDKVIDSRSARNDSVIRRRRSCLRCGRHEDLDERKLFNGIQWACEKRPITTEHIQELADKIVEELESEYEHEVSSQDIGKKVMDKLEKLDEVAFVRFASVYRRFRDVNQFLGAIGELLKKE